MPSPAPSRWTIRVLTGFLCLIWGSTWIVIQDGLADLPPMTSAATRFGVAALLMIVVARPLARLEGGERPPLRLTLVVGTLSIAIPYGIVYWSETVLPSGLTSVLWAVFPLFQACLGHFFLPAERLAGRHVVGFALGFAGVVLLFATDLRALGPAAIPAGLVLVMSPLSAALGNTFVKRHGSTCSSALLNRNAILLAAVLLAGAAATAERGADVAWTGGAMSGIAYLAVAGTVVTFSLYFWLLRFVAAHRLSLIAYVTPAIALGLGWFFADEPVRATTLAGAASILLGVALVVRGRP